MRRLLSLRKKGGNNEDEKGDNLTDNSSETTSGKDLNKDHERTREEMLQEDLFQKQNPEIAKVRYDQFMQETKERLCGELGPNYMEILRARAKGDEIE